VARGRYSPLNPVALSTVTPCVNQSDTCVLSAIQGDNSDLLLTVSKLWIRDTDIILDATFGRGAFWTKLPGKPSIQHDIAIDQVDCRHLPEPDSSVDVLVLDPPYRPTHGSQGFSSNGLASAYQLGTQGLDTINDVLSLYSEALAEAARVVKPGGRVLVKCQDMSYGHRLHLVSLDVLRSMVESGFEFVDQFILLNQSRLTSSKWQVQERARRSHSVLWVGVRI
jgi:hypothetical protein